VNIWLLTTEFPPCFGGGIATYSGHVVEALAAAGHRVTVLVRDPLWEGPDFKVDAWRPGATVVRFGDGFMPREAETLEGAARVARQIYAALLAWRRRSGDRPDVVEVQDWDALGYFVLVGKHALEPALRDIPVTVTVHGPKFLIDRYEERPLYRLPEYWTGWMERSVLRQADHVVFPSQYARAKIAEVVPNLGGTVIRHPMPLPPAPDPSRDRDTVVYIGRYQVLKGVEDLVAAMDRLWAAGRTTRLELVGADGWHYVRGRTMGQYLKDRYAPRVEAGLLALMGPLVPAEVGARLDRAGVVAFPSRFETLGYGAVEAMARGRVLVGSDAGGHRELVRSGENGWIAPAGDAAAWAATLARALEAPDAAWDAMGQAARATVAAACDPATVVAAKVALWERVIGAQHPRRVYPFVRPVAPRPAAAPTTLSVVMPYHNMGRYVEEAVASVLGATRPPEEVVLVEDGSTDAASIARVYALEAAAPTVRVVRGPNRGLAAARNRGAAAARGAVLAFLDPDDRVHPAYFERALAVLAAYDNVSVVGAWTEQFENDTRIWPTWNAELPYVLYHDTLNTSALVVRRADFLRWGQNDPRLAYGLEDWEALVRMVAAGLGAVALPEVLFAYRVRTGSMARRLTHVGHLYLYERLLEANRAVAAAWGAELAALVNANGPQYYATRPTEPTALTPPPGWFPES
jgi:glycosyltransferase involved in cell wall biosynthesis/GT2 family glycosyltransferase